MAVSLKKFVSDVFSYYSRVECINPIVCSVQFPHFSILKREMATKKRKRTQKVITVANVNKRLLKMQKFVKQPIAVRGHQHLKELKLGKSKPFREVHFINEGDSHAAGQPSITFLREVLAGCVYPESLKTGRIPSDVKDRVNLILKACSAGNMGAYTDSIGLLEVRQHIAEYICKRDHGVPSAAENIIVQDGTAAAVAMILSLFVNNYAGKKSGIMLPIPGDPFYRATLDSLAIHPIEYFCDEDCNWMIKKSELKRSIEIGRCKSVPKAIIVINPGNPAGQVLSKKNIEDIIKFAYDNNLVILADEVYQQNIYEEESDQFFSFKKVKHLLGEPYNEVETASFFSISKGFTGEYGLRGGYAELDNFDTGVKGIIAKSAAVNLCSNTVGQVGLSVLCKPPGEADPSFDEFEREKCCILNSLAAKAKLIVQRINDIKGLSVHPIKGSLYAFVKIDMPKKAIAHAEKERCEPDVFWCNELLDKTGFVVSPGVHFGQMKGTYHFRTTIIPAFKILEKFSSALKDFQADFNKRFA